MTSHTGLDNALVILQGIFILLPLLGILIQTMINFYSNNDPEVLNFEKQRALSWAFRGFVLLVLGAGLIIWYLWDRGLDIVLVSANVLILLGLLGFGVGLYSVMGHVMSALESSGGDES